MKCRLRQRKIFPKVEKYRTAAKPENVTFAPEPNAYSLRGTAKLYVAYKIQLYFTDNMVAQK